MKPIIEVENISKKYKYGEVQPYYTLRDTLAGIFKSSTQIFNKDEKLKKDEFWALKDISFKVKEGEV